MSEKLSQETNLHPGDKPVYQNKGGLTIWNRIPLRDNLEVRGINWGAITSEGTENMTCKGKDVRPASRQNIIYWAFFLPNFLGVLYFALLPMLQVLVRSFQSAISGRWMGFGNYLGFAKK